MKFSTVFGSIVAALAVGVAANPIPAPEAAALALPEAAIEPLHERAASSAPSRAEKAAYEDVKKANNNKDLDAGWYVFSLTFNEGSAGASPKNAQEIKDLQKKLGFDHISAVVGEVKVVTGGSRKKPTKTYGFSGKSFDMQIKDLKDSTSKAISSGIPFAASANNKKTLKYVKKTTAQKGAEANLKAIGDAWVAAHPDYSVETNNCKSYYDNMVSKL